MGAMRAIFDAGLTVPDDIAIIGVDKIEEGRYSRPSLTTVSLDTPLIAHHAVARIAARIAEPEAPAVEVVAPHAAVPRRARAGPLRSPPTPLDLSGLGVVAHEVGDGAGGVREG